MSFVSLEFAALYALTLPLFYLLSQSRRWMLVLVVSYIFYMSWKPEYILIIAFTTIFDYFVALGIYGTGDRGRKKLLLCASILVNFGILFTFKYFNFFAGAYADLAARLDLPPTSASFSLLLPIGVSFYTFQEVAYIIDVYRGEVKPERNLGIYATFVAFFPQLVAGPINRAKSLMPQFHKRIVFDPVAVTEGFRLMLWGVFKKVVIADRLALYVNQVYNQPQEHGALTLLAATFFFAFQIYCDFSGYSDIAIGTAKTLGFDLVTNFRQPYFSRSIKEFWQRWHISLSTWFKDYLYYPLGGNRVGPIRWRMNLLIVFLVSGLWHGANWTFIIWGALHGSYLVVETWMERFSHRFQGAWTSPLKIGITFSAVCFAWIFFRANTLHDAWYIVTHLFQGPFQPGMVAAPFGSRQDLLIALALIAVLIGIDAAHVRNPIGRVVGALPVPARWALYYGFTAAVFLFGTWGKQEFIYFQF